jgi:uncharacterized membrane protein (UPF0182 family)
LREINYSELTGTQTNWQNMHTVYTHGYGFVAAPANKVVCTGAPVLRFRWLPRAGRRTPGHPLRSGL